jgi:hypothetical protein
MMITAESATEPMDKGLPVSVRLVQERAAYGKVEVDGGGSPEEFGTRWKLLLNRIGMLPGVDSEELQTTKLGRPNSDQEGESGIQGCGPGTHAESRIESCGLINSSAEDRQALLAANGAGASMRPSCSTARHRTPAVVEIVGKLGTSGKRIPHVSDAEHLGTRKGNKQASPVDSVVEHREGIAELAAWNSDPSQNRPVAIDATGQAERQTEQSFSAAVGLGRGQSVDLTPTGYPGEPESWQVGPSGMRSLDETSEETAPGGQDAADLGDAASTASMTAAGAGDGLEHPENAGRAAPSTSDQRTHESSRSSSLDSASNSIGVGTRDDAYERRAEHAEGLHNSADVSLKRVSALGDQLSAQSSTSRTHLSARDLLRGVSRAPNGTSPTPSAPAAVSQVDSVLSSLRNSIQNSEGEPSGSVHTRTSAEIRGAQPNTIEALDGSLHTADPRWIQAGGHRAEAGYQDPSLGWVSVRAEMGSGGGVHASVIPSSSDAAQVLNGHLSGLDAHLANQHLPVHPVTISLSQESQFSSGPGDGNQREYGGHTNQNNQQASPDDRDTAGRSKSITTSLLRSDDQGSRELRILSASPLTPGGMYVSLMA